MPHGRRSIRLPYFHYGGGASYFVTICVHNRRQEFSAVRDGRVELTRVGAFVADHWQRISTWQTGICCDEFILMPDHLHGILEFDDQVIATLSRVISWFKGTCLVEARRAGLWGNDPLWQRGYYEHVIRNATDRDMIREYIRSNPLRWEMRSG